MSDLSKLLNSRYDEIEELISRLYNDEKEAIGYAPTNPTLKAALFLLYYNLMESIIYSIFEMLFDEVVINCSNFGQLDHQLQIQYKKYDKDGTMAENDLLKLDLSKYSGKITLFSGNIDARAIRALLKDWGLEDDFHAVDEEKLHDIRNFRNVLAHGERAFKEVGKGYTLNDMKKYGEATYNYLLQLVKIVNSYFSGKMYLAANRI